MNGDTCKTTMRERDMDMGRRRSCRIARRWKTSCFSFFRLGRWGFEGGMNHERRCELRRNDWIGSSLVPLQFSAGNSTGIMPSPLNHTTMIPPQHRKHVLSGLLPLSVLVSSVLISVWSLCTWKHRFFQHHDNRDPTTPEREKRKDHTEKVSDMGRRKSI